MENVLPVAQFCSRLYDLRDNFNKRKKKTPEFVGCA
jgi:hypothetical protein